LGLDCPSPYFSSGKLGEYLLASPVCREDAIISDHNTSVAESFISNKISISLVNTADQNLIDLDYLFALLPNEAG